MSAENPTPQECFKEDGFRSGNIKLPGMDLIISLRPNQFFRYDGIVSSLGLQIAGLPKDIRSILNRVDLSSVAAFNHDFVIGDHVGFMMLIKNVSPRVNVHNEAHEAAEIAYSFGLTPQLEEYIKSLGFDVNISNFTRHQIGAVVGFIQAKKEGYNVADLYRDYDQTCFNLLCRLGLI